MKIYTVYEGKIESLEVRETKEMFISLNDKSSGLPFGCGRHFHKNEYATTPGEAIKKELKRLYISQTNYRANLVEVNTHIKELKILRRKYEAEKKNHAETKEN